MYPVQHICRVLGVSRSWYYAPSLRDEGTDTALRDAIEEIILAFPGYGYRRVTKALQRDGWDINHKRVLRIMRDNSLLCQLQRHWVRTTDSAHQEHIHPNLLRNLDVTGLNHVWIADITYIRLERGFVYLAAMLDAYSRKVVGWALSRWIDTALTLLALERALAQRPAPMIHHSDRGVQYAAGDYVVRLERAGVQMSMSAKGTPYDNAKAESFFKTLKAEEVHLKEYRDIDDAFRHLSRFLDDVYNTKRLHSALGYRPPVEFEEHVGHGYVDHST